MKILKNKIQYVFINFLFNFQILIFFLCFSNVKPKATNDLESTLIAVEEKVTQRSALKGIILLSYLRKVPSYLWYILYDNPFKRETGDILEKLIIRHLHFLAYRKLQELFRKFREDLRFS